MKYVVVILCLLCSSVCFGSDMYWTNVTDHYFNPPHTDALERADNCGLKYFKSRADVNTWYRSKRRELVKSGMYSNLELKRHRKYLRDQWRRLTYEWYANKIEREKQGS